MSQTVVSNVSMLSIHGHRAKIHELTIYLVMFGGAADR